MDTKSIDLVEGGSAEIEYINVYNTPLVNGMVAFYRNIILWLIYPPKKKIILWTLAYWYIYANVLADDRHKKAFLVQLIFHFVGWQEEEVP